MIFGLFKKKAPPILRAEMLQPVDAPISAAQAKTLFKDWMVRIGHLSDKDKLDKAELNDHVVYLTDEIRDREVQLKGDADSAKAELAEEVKDLKDDLKELRSDIAKEKDQSEKVRLQGEVKEIEAAIADLNQKEIPEVLALEKFRTDKREFLVNYINTQVHGIDWRSKQ